MRAAASAPSRFGHFAAIFGSRAFGPTLLNSMLYSLGSALFALGDRRGAGLACRADRRAMPANPLSGLDRLARHSLCALHRRLAAAARQSRAGQRAAARLVRRRRACHQRLFARRHDLRRGAAVVAARLPAAGAGVPQRRCLVRGGRQHLRRRAGRDARGISPSAWRARRCWRSALLVFIKASESFEVPALVGLPGSARVLTSTIYQRLTLDIPPDTGSASAFGVLLLVVMAVLLQIYGRVAAQIPPLPDRHRQGLPAARGAARRAGDMRPAR